MRAWGATELVRHHGRARRGGSGGIAAGETTRVAVESEIELELRGVGRALLEGLDPLHLPNGAFGTCCQRRRPERALTFVQRLRTEKILRSLMHAVRKRPVEPDRVERIVSGIQRRLESLGESEIPSTVVGEMVMDALRTLDHVAYIRFASVYKNFREAKDFEDFVGKLGGDSDE